MTREEQIKQAAEAFARSIHSIRPELNADSFRQGAEWADSHPNGNVIHWQTGEPTEVGTYLITPCEGTVACIHFHPNEQVDVDFFTTCVYAWCKLSEIKPYKEDQP